MDKESNDWPSVLKNQWSKKRLSRETASKLADKTRELTQREEATPDDDEGPKTL